MRAEIDMAALARLAKAAPERAKKASIRGVNDALFEMRKRTPDLLRQAIDKPTPFTLRPPAVQKAGSKAEGALSILPAQAGYLGYAEFGMDKKNSILPSRFSKSQDKFGNLMKKFKRNYWDALGVQKVRAPRPKTKKRGGSGKVGKYFIGRPTSSKRAGVWERAAGNSKLILVASFTRNYKYKKKFGIRDRWQAMAEIEVSKSINKRLEEENKKLLSR